MFQFKQSLRQKAFSLGLFLLCSIIIAVLASGCSSEDSQKAEYKEAVEAAFSSVKDEGKALVALEQQYDQRELTEKEFDSEISRIKSSVSALEAELQEIEPPERYVETHASFVRSAEILSQTIEDLEKASNFRSRAKTKAAIIKAELNLARARKIYENAHAELS